MERKYLITGANRGIGLALCECLAKMGRQVIATCRNPSTANDLTALKNNFPELIQVFPMDVTNQESVDNVQRELGDWPLDCLINNAGVLNSFGTSIRDLNLDHVLDCFTTNTIGAMRTTQVFLPNLERGDRPVIINISSKVGSIEDNTSGLGYAYRMSKTAMNMFNKSLSLDLHNKGITCLALHPGWVQTDMGGDNAPTTKMESATGLLRVIDSADLSKSGKFLDFRGEEIPW